MSAQLKQQKTSRALTSLGKPTYLPGEVYLDPEIVAKQHVFNQGMATVYVYKFRASFPEIIPQFTQIQAWTYGDVTGLTNVVQLDAGESIRALSQRLCEEHTSISTYEGIFGGAPHLKGLRISVADILEQLYLSGSIASVQKIYSPDVSEDQIKEAIAYAQDFLQSAISSSP